MTVDVAVLGDVSEVSRVDMEEKGGLEASSCEDLSAVGGERTADCADHEAAMFPDEKKMDAEGGELMIDGEESDGQSPDGEDGVCAVKASLVVHSNGDLIRGGVLDPENGENGPPSRGDVPTDELTMDVPSDRVQASASSKSCEPNGSFELDVVADVESKTQHLEDEESRTVVDNDVLVGLNLGSQGKESENGILVGAPLKDAVMDLLLDPKMANKESGSGSEGANGCLSEPEDPVSGTEILEPEMAMTCTNNRESEPEGANGCLSIENVQVGLNLGSEGAESENEMLVGAPLKDAVMDLVLDPKMADKESGSEGANGCLSEPEGPVSGTEILEPEMAMTCTNNRESEPEGANGCLSVENVQVGLNLGSEGAESENEILVGVPLKDAVMDLVLDPKMANKELGSGSEGANGCLSEPEGPVSGTEILESEILESEMATTHTNNKESEPEGANGCLLVENVDNLLTNQTGGAVSETEASHGPLENGTLASETGNLITHTDEARQWDGSELAHPGVDVKSEVEAERAPALKNKDVVDSDAPVSDSMVDRGSAVESNSETNAVPCTLKVENMGDESAEMVCNDESACQVAEGIEELASPSTSSSTDALDGQISYAEIVKSPCYLIKVPRFDDEIIRQKIKHVQQEVDEKTRIRDAIFAEIQKIKATCTEHSANVRDALSEEKDVRDQLKSKRQEMDSMQSLINRARNAISAGDIGNKIGNLEHMIEHETLPLVEEKQYVREIQQLKQQQHQLSSNLGKPAELEEAVGEIDKIEERLKYLKKEAESLKDKISRAESVTRAVRKLHLDERERLNKLRGQFKAADDVRQTAYANFQSLRQQSFEKNKLFWAYKEDARLARNHAAAKSRDELRRLCDDQVNSTMDLWNSNDEFRKEYVRCNRWSTVRRLRTLDGRSLGADEEPPPLIESVSEKTDHIPPVGAGAGRPSMSTMNEEKKDVRGEAKKDDHKPAAQLLNPGAAASESSKPAATLLEQVNEPAKPAVVAKESVKVDVRNVTKEGEDVKETEEKEKSRRAEELRNQEAEAKLKEQRRLEEKAKAKEGQERKNRKAAKAQAVAELKAKREAEEQEKKRERRARKKERKREKKAATAEGTSSMGVNDGGRSEMPPGIEEETEVKAKSPAVTKGHTKSTGLAKAKPMPFVGRTRGRRRTMEWWAWSVVACLLLAAALFFLGDSSFSWDDFVRRFGF